MATTPASVFHIRGTPARPHLPKPPGARPRGGCRLWGPLPCWLSQLHSVCVLLSCKSRNSPSCFTKDVDGIVSPRRSLLLAGSGGGRRDSKEGGHPRDASSRGEQGVGPPPDRGRVRNPELWPAERLWWRRLLPGPRGLRPVVGGGCHRLEGTTLWTVENRPVCHSGCQA